MVELSGPTYSTREAVKRIGGGCTEDRLNDLMRRGKLAEPIRIGGRRVWTDETIEEARRVYKEHK